MCVLYACTGDVLVTRREVLFARQLEWLTRDLQTANRNRQQRPWIIVFGHRPMYCTTGLASTTPARASKLVRILLVVTADGDCDGAADTIRNAFEPLFYRFGVDLYLCAHQVSRLRTVSVI